MASVEGSTLLIAEEETPDESIRMRVKNILVESMLQVKNHKKWRVLIVDYRSMRILSSTLSLLEIMNENICYIDIIDKEGQRDSLPNMHAIYFLSACESSINALIGDFESMPTRYGACSVYFTSELTREMMGLLVNSAVVPFLCVVKEVNIDFYVHSKKVFHLDNEEGFRFFYLNEFAEYNEPYQKEIAEKIGQVCAAINMKPLHIRHVSNTSQLALYCRRVLENSSLSINPTCKLLILDRSFDLITPLLHEFTYEAMVADLLEEEINDGRFVQKYHTAQNEVRERQVLIDERDPIFLQIRYKHLASVIEWLVSNVKTFAKNTINQVQESEELSSIANTMRNLPKFQELGAKYSVHLDIANMLIKEFNNRKLSDLAMIEQNVSTGMNVKGGSVQIDKEIENLKVLIDNQTVRKSDLIRTILIIGFNKDCSEAQIRKLLELARFDNSYFELYTRLEDLQKKAKQKKTTFFHFSKKDKSKKDQQIGYQLSRWQPQIKNIISDLVGNTLNINFYPKVDITESDDIKWQKTKNIKPIEKSKYSTKLIVFVVGGITHSEIRAVNEFMEANRKVDIILGSTDVIRPNNFLMQAKNP